MSQTNSHEKRFLTFSFSLDPALAVAPAARALVPSLAPETAIAPQGIEIAPQETEIALQGTAPALRAADALAQRAADAATTATSLR